MQDKPAGPMPAWRRSRWGDLVPGPPAAPGDRL